MRLICILSLLFALLICVTACKEKGDFLSETESSVTETSPGFGIIITDDDKTLSDESDVVSPSELTSSELEQLASEWDDVEVEIEEVDQNGNAIAPSKPTDNSDNKSSSVITSDEDNTSSGKKNNSTSSKRGDTSTSSKKNSTSTSSKKNGTSTSSKANNNTTTSSSEVSVSTSSKEEDKKEPTTQTSSSVTTSKTTTLPDYYEGRY